nr:hypothetical protein [Tanacetum cinerariifolium]
FEDIEYVDASVPDPAIISVEEENVVQQEEEEDIEYVDASVPDHEIVSVEEENVVHQEEEEVDLEEISQVQDVVLREKLFSITRLISNIESLKDNSTLDQPPDDNFDLEPEDFLKIMKTRACFQSSN